MLDPWLNYHHLLYFWMVAREGGLAPAGRVLRLAHPTLSAQIKQLERSLGVALFERRGRKLALTEAGRTAYRYADDIFGMGRELVEAMRGGAPGHGRLTVGVVDSVPKMLVRQLLEPVLATGVHLVCQEDRYDRLLADLALHTLDVVIAESPAPPGAAGPIYTHLLGECGVTFLGPAALATRCRPGFPASLHGAPFLLPLGGSVLRRALDAWFMREGIVPRVVAEAEDSALLKALATDGHGVVVVPHAAEGDSRRQYALARIGRTEQVRERFYAISGERKLAHPAVLALHGAARAEIFKATPRPRAAPGSSRRLTAKPATGRAG
ncbi:MAG: LysR family transcriptional regulator [Kofleriaceae bacterium]|jgi:LysR family transcriptional activator of nhaA|nr:LysR family transcriptional regulator [Kofleriaceae bacterium]MBP6836965.1 LysR family transcriptional regulator [Kofleriaceae bacterium]MBP9204836.1 LysR family transcriptional regulator [Kofleriaceae bacterium]